MNDFDSLWEQGFNEFYNDWYRVRISRPTLLEVSSEAKIQITKNTSEAKPFRYVLITRYNSYYY